MGHRYVLVKAEDEVTTVTLNRPEKRNALSRAVIEELLDVFEEVGGSDARAVVLAANGPVFCSGHDLGDMIDLDHAAMRRMLQRCTELMTLLQQVPQPVVAEVHALATAAGCQLVASCDLAVAADTAQFQLPGGRGDGFCHTPLVAVARNVGRKRAAELALTGDPIDAATAADWGLVNRVVPADQLHEATYDLARRAGRGRGPSKGIGKQAFYAQVDLDQPKAYAFGVEVMAAQMSSGPAHERQRAFVAGQRTTG